MSIARTSLLMMSLAGLAAPCIAGAQQPAPASGSDIAACAAIAAQAERLACYDRLAGRGPAPVSTPPSGGSRPSVAPSAPAPAPAAAAGEGRTASPPNPTPSAPAPSAAGSATPPAAATPVAPASKEAFGLYTAEHPAAPKATTDSIVGRVVETKYDTYGRETVLLEGGPVWQLDGSDALLATGDSVTIKRASLGSYFLTTASGRTHRVKRLR
jgi:hypothetical protein